MDEYLKNGFMKPVEGMMTMSADEVWRKKELERREGPRGCVASCGCALEVKPFHMFGTIHGETEDRWAPLVSVVVPTYPKRHAYHALTLASSPRRPPIRGRVATRGDR